MNKLMMFVLLSGLTGCAEMPAGTHKAKLATAAEIQGYSCARDYAWFYPDGRLGGCTVARDTDFGAARVPAGSIINLTLDGKPSAVFLQHDTNIGGYACRGGNRLLGPSEGAITEFYPSGRLKLCWLVDDQVVQGVPCAHSGMFTGDSSVEYHESGKLRSCKLARDHVGHRQGERFSPIRQGSD